MNTKAIQEAAKKNIECIEVLINQIESLRVITESEKHFKKCLSEISRLVSTDLLIIQDFAIHGNEVSDFEILDLLSDYSETIN